MRSAELARLAGSTVRTLRHYHQIGLLDEPPRTAGGYREYGLDHLVRLLAIRRLVELGLSLDAVADALDGPPQGAAALLDALDDELRRSIEQLERRRTALAAVRSVAGDPTLRPEGARYVERLAAAGAGPDMLADERALLLLVGHGLGDAAQPFLAAVERSMLEPEQAQRSIELLALFRAAQDADEDELVRRFVEDAAALMAALGAQAPIPESTALDALFALFSSERLSAVQQRVLRRTAAAFAT
ncbi:MerR family transcriptional regulator [Arenivirga flava]|uniref:MerR family transcriptional regulator n=1 Tax=Arenivirga flava TaxID=1930060 RepID=A0AA37UHT5_9MICO|nr:MerR family transcriptional regulator [Arenivirga flava]GMA27417.1 MerR family transcriptional regulator [Arenivirga flava]